MTIDLPAWVWQVQHSPDYRGWHQGNHTNLVLASAQSTFRTSYLLAGSYDPLCRKFHPQGIPAMQDKLLQLTVKRILEAIYEQDFLRCSY